MIYLLARDMQQLSQRVFHYWEECLHRRIWKSAVSWLLGSTDVVWATSWFDSIATSGCSADEVVVSWEWYRSPSRAVSYMKIDEKLPSCSISSHSSRRQGPVECESLPGIWSPVSDANGDALFKKCDDFQESQGAGIRGCAVSRPARWQRGGQRCQRRNRAIACAEVRSFLTMTSPLAHLGRPSRDVRVGKLVEYLLKRRAVRALAARQSHLTALGKFLKLVKERALHLDEDVEVNDAQVESPNGCFLEFQHHHGSQLLAAVVDRWPSFSRFGSSQLPRNRFSCGSAHPHFVNNVSTPIRISEKEKRRILSHRLCHFSHASRS